VAAARERQRDRLRAPGLRVNAAMNARQVRHYCPVPADAERLLAAAITRLGLSARGHDRVLKVARTIADLDGADALRAEHCAEAIQYRGLDRQWPRVERAGLALTARWDIRVDDVPSRRRCDRRACWGRREPLLPS